MSINLGYKSFHSFCSEIMESPMNYSIGFYNGNSPQKHQLKIQASMEKALSINGWKDQRCYVQYILFDEGIEDKILLSYFHNQLNCKNFNIEITPRL